MLPFSVVRLTSHMTTLSVPGRRFPVETWVLAPKLTPPSVEERKRMSPKVAPTRSAQVTFTCPFGLTPTLHPNGAGPCAWITCSLTYVAPPSVEREKRSSLVSAPGPPVVSMNLVQQT